MLCLSEWTSAEVLAGLSVKWCCWCPAAVTQDGFGLSFMIRVKFQASSDPFVFLSASYTQTLPALCLTPEDIDLEQSVMIC